MNVIVCLDEKNGIAFNNRRQSSDRAIRSDMLEMIGKRKLYVHSYTAKQFKDDCDKLIVDDGCMDKAEAGDFVFIESTQEINCFAGIEQFIVYRWKKEYPADLYLNIDFTSSDWKLLYSGEFEGYSHERIGKEIYVRQGYI